MSESAHSNTSQQWLIFFFVCFAMSVFAIGVWAAFNPTISLDQGGYIRTGTGGGGGGH